MKDSIFKITMLKYQNFGSEELVLAGIALFGEHWQTDLTRALGLSDTRRIRQWMAPKDNKANYRPIPIGVWEDIIKLLEERKIQIGVASENGKNRTLSPDQRSELALCNLPALLPT